MLRIYGIKRLCCSIHYGKIASVRYSIVQDNQKNKVSESDGKCRNEEKPTTQKENKFECPKPYLDESIASSSLDSRLNNVRLDVKQYYANWRNNMEKGDNWFNIWSAPAPFDPKKFSCDIRMGAKMRAIPEPDKYDNLEIMKVQNFLHLTPPAIKKHCQGLKKFCTKFPEELRSDEDCEREFPVEIRTVDYVRAGQSQRNMDARKVEMKIRLCNLVLDNHARLKLIKLAGDKYNKESDILSIKSTKCPVRKQNREYLDYLLTVLYYEAWKTEKWESRENIQDEDGIYWWKDSNSYKNLLHTLKSHSDYKSLFEDVSTSNDISNKIVNNEKIKKYRDAVVKIKVPKPNASPQDLREAMFQYKECVRTMLNLPELR